MNEEAQRTKTEKAICSSSLGKSWVWGTTYQFRLSYWRRRLNMLTECIKNFLNGARRWCVCECYETAVVAAAASGRYELDARRANGRTRTCSKSTQGHTLKNRDYISNLLSVRTCSRASHISCVPTKIELSVCSGGHTPYTLSHEDWTMFIHSSVRFCFRISLFSFHFII